jgi:hypothetical protein
MWRRGVADKILVSQGPEEVSEGANRKILLKLGVPARAIETFGTANRNTKEAVALREWAERNAASAFIIPSEIFPARRVRWTFHREFFGTAVISRFRPSNPGATLGGTGGRRSVDPSISETNS